MRPTRQPATARGCLRCRRHPPDLPVLAYDLSSRSAKGHRTQIREALDFRPAARADEEWLTGWLADAVCPVELVEDRLREALLVQCRSDRIEPPGRIERIVAAARARADRVFCVQSVARLAEPRTAARIPRSAATWRMDSGVPTSTAVAARVV